MTDVIEAVARALPRWEIVEHWRKYPADAECAAAADELETELLTDARAAISAYEAALKERGFVVVPREPTEAMQRAGKIVINIKPGVTRITTWGSNVWGAMISAALGETR